MSPSRVNLTAIGAVRLRPKMIERQTMFQSVLAVVAPVTDGGHHICRTIIVPAVAAIASTFVIAPLAAAPANANSHSAWCSQHYRSYNALTDRFTGRDGITRQCVSPSDNRRVRSFAQTGLSAAPSDSIESGATQPNGPASDKSCELPDDRGCQIVSDPAWPVQNE